MKDLFIHRFYLISVTQRAQRLVIISWRDSCNHSGLGIPSDTIFK